MRKNKTVKRLLILITIWTIPLIFLLLPDEETFSEGQAQYRLAWDLGTVQMTETGWTVTTNLDYQVEITSAYSVAYEVQLTACEHSHGWFDWSTLGIGVAYAGHGDDSNDSTFDSSLVENLLNPQTQFWGEVTLYEPTYCEAFFLVARGATDTNNLPDDVDMYGSSVYLEGTYIAPDSDTAIEFTLQTGNANGAIDDFVQNEIPVHIALSDETITIEITRSLDTLLDNIDFADMNTDDASFQVLRNIINGTRFEVVSGQVHEN